MNHNSNFGYPPAASSFPSSLSAPFSSTPLRPQRPRFAYSGPSSYPRPRSSASKPNPDSFAEGNYQSGHAMSERNNFAASNNIGDSSFDNRRDNFNSFGNRNDFGQSNTYGDSMLNNYSGSDYRMDSSYLSNSQYPTMSYIPPNNDPYPNSFPSDKSPYQDNSAFLSQNSSAYFTCIESMRETPKRSPFSKGPASNFTPSSVPTTSPAKFPYRSPVGLNKGKDFAGRFQKKQFNPKANTGDWSNPPWKKKTEPKKDMGPKSEYKCIVCNIEFTSSIPYDMHLRGAKHAKKLKTQDALHSIQSQVGQSKDIAAMGTQFRCDLCSIVANSSLQLQTHLDGTKHKAKVLQQMNQQEKQEAAAAPPPVAQPVAKSTFNGKSNGATVRTLPAEFDEANPAKKAKLFSCDICSLTVNSSIQLQQHLISKKHAAKVEGKPYPPPRKFKPKAEGQTEGEQDAPVQMDVNDVANSEGGAPKTVMGVKTLSSSFIQGGTLL